MKSIRKSLFAFWCYFKYNQKRIAFKIWMKIFRIVNIFERHSVCKKIIFVSKTYLLSYRKWFLKVNIFFWKHIYFRFGNIFTFDSETLSFCKNKRKANRKKSLQLFWSWPMLAILLGQGCDLQRFDYRFSYADDWLQ